MAYVGTSISIPLGQLGLRTDDPMTSLPPNALIKANNVSLYSGRIEKALGSSRYNSTVLPNSIVGLHDWWPDPSTQRLIALTTAGNAYRDTGTGTFGAAAALNNVETQKITFSALPDAGAVTFRLSADASTSMGVTTATTASDIQTNLRAGITALASCIVVMRQATLGAVGTDLSFYVIMVGTSGDQTLMDFSANSLTSGGPGVTITFAEFIKGSTSSSLGTLTPDCHLLSGGAESSGNNRKLFVYSNGQKQINVIDGDVSYLRPLKLPPVDWLTGNFPTFGGIYQNRHFVVGTAADRHRVYLSSPSDHEDFTTTTLTFQVFPGEGDGLVSAAVYRGLLFLHKKPFGVYIIDGRDPSTANWTIERYSDAFGVSSPHATQQVLGDLVTGNSFGSFTSLQATNAFGDFEAGDLLANNQVETYIRDQFNMEGVPFMQSMYYAHRKAAFFTGRAASGNTQNRILKVDVAKQSPRISIDTKDQPNCLTHRRNSAGIPIPVYGATDGYVYLMEQASYNVNGAAYTGEFQTAYTDFSFASSELGGKNKIFDFLDVNYVPTGNNNFYCDVFIDGAFRQTLTFTQVFGAALDSFRLDVDSLAGDPSGRRNRAPLKSCTGNRISLRFYNSNANEGFKIERATIGFRLSAEQVYAAQV